MAGSTPARDVPDLLNYAVGLGTYARWNGPNMLGDFLFKMSWDYKLGWPDLGFMSSKANIGDGKTWRPVRPLGRGGYGIVGLWHAVDADGNIVDEMAIKQATYDLALENHRFPGLANEAVFQYQFNQRNPNDAVHLRRYKYYEAEELYRMYLEYCPHGDLQRLRIRYRCWATHFPELFLWHVFHSLSRAVASMEGPWTEFGTGRPYDPNRIMLNMDIKHSNILLSEPATKVHDGGTDATSDYPGIKMCDFGLAVITGSDDRRNPKDFWGMGTVGYMPPEQRHFGVQWDEPPNFVLSIGNSNRNPGRLERVRLNDIDNKRKRAAQLAAQDAARKEGFDFYSPHHVWAVGKIMWDLMTLAEPDHLDQRMERLTEQEYNNHPPERWPNFGGHASHRYTDRLKDLVSSCLRIERGMRPGPMELETDTQTGLRRAKEKARKSADPEQPGPNPGHVVYYRGNDINVMPYGKHAVPYLDRGDWKRLVGDTFQDKNLEPLVPTSAFRHRMSAMLGDELPPLNRMGRPWRMEGDEMAFNPVEIVGGQMAFQEPPPQQQQPAPAPAPAPAPGPRRAPRRAAAPVPAPAPAPAPARARRPAPAPAQPPPPPAPAHLPQQEDYEKLRVQDLTYELKFNRGIRPCPVLHGTKAVLIRMLLDEDARGNVGQGAVRLPGPTHKTMKRKWQVEG